MIKYSVKQRLRGNKYGGILEINQKSTRSEPPVKKYIVELTVEQREELSQISYQTISRGILLRKWLN
jgi:hypothetical protein